jgi:cell wall-associated NlpC family hydrolase
MIKYIFLGIVLVALLAGAQGCASTAPARGVDGTHGSGHSVVAAADDVVGTPYRYGGRTPAGFDCSGLVHYAHRRAGIEVPRTTGGQRRQARPVQMSDLRPGDVLFFQLDGKKVSHVGIYAGGGDFIHAPSTGKTVAYGALDSPFWGSRLTGAGRFY